MDVLDLEKDFEDEEGEVNVEVFKLCFDRSSISFSTSLSSCFAFNPI